MEWFLCRPGALRMYCYATQNTFDAIIPYHTTLVAAPVRPNSRQFCAGSENSASHIIALGFCSMKMGFCEVGATSRGLCNGLVLWLDPPAQNVVAKLIQPELRRFPAGYKVVLLFAHPGAQRIVIEVSVLLPVRLYGARGDTFSIIISASAVTVAASFVA
uniref:Uncharacterized protein n=1 Tax=Anopheles coluzzii TaxID=1518534 RepID=A0A8W7Q0K1_ANOCL